MRKAASVVYWFCAASAVELILYGVWNMAAGRAGRPVPILLFCVFIAAVFYLAGIWARHMARRAATDA